MTLSHVVIKINYYHHQHQYHNQAFPKYYCDMTAERRNSGARETTVATEWLCKHVSMATLGSCDLGGYGISMTL
jgi:hypothetical protein